MSEFPSATVQSSRRRVRSRAVLPVAIAAALAAPGCIDVVGSDSSRFVERVDKAFTVSGTPDVALSTFDGAIEIRAWDKPEVAVVVEKRAATKEAADSIDIHAEQNGNQVTVEARVPKHDGFGIHFGNYRSAKLVVSVPATSNVAARSGDGSIDIERVAGRLDLRSGDGAIHGREISGDVKAHTGDGSIGLTDVAGTLEITTGDGSVRASGRLTAVRARSGDGGVVIHADSGSVASSDWDISTGDGSITLEIPDAFDGELDAHTGDGTVRMNDVTLSNVAGTLNKHTVNGRLGAGGRMIRLRTGDGSITLKRSGTRSTADAVRSPAEKPQAEKPAEKPER